MKNYKYALLLLGLIPACGYAQGIYISQEQFHTQTGLTQTTAFEGDFYAEIDGVDGVTGGTVSANAGTLNTSPAILIDEGDGLVRYGAEYGTVAEMTADHPTDATYTINLTGGPGGSVVIPGPGTGVFADYAPAVPLFAITGVSGTWSTEGGWAVFRFVPAESFTVTLLNPYSAAGQGTHYGYYLSAADENDNELADIGGGPLEAGEPFVAPTLTFTYGLDPQEGEIGFVAGSVINLESAFFNILSLSDSGLGDGSQTGFIVGSGTLLTMIAVPEPSTYAVLAGLGALGVALVRRRRIRTDLVKVGQRAD